MHELNIILGIQTKLSTAYHLQTDGQTERLNQDVKQYLRLFVSQRQNDWPEWIACAEFVYNNKVHSATKVLSFMLIMDVTRGWELNPRGQENWNRQRNLLNK